MAVTASFDPNAGTLSTFGDNLDNNVTVSRNAAGAILLNGGAVPIQGGTPTVPNTTLVQAFGLGGNDVLTLSETNGALPKANLFGGNGNDTLTGGSSADQLFGQADNDTLLGKGGNDFLFGGEGNDTLTGGDADDQVFGEAGDDRMIWNPGDDSDLFEGGADIDTAEVNGGNGAEVFTLTANGTRVRFDRLDPAPFFLDIGTTEKIVVNMNGGDDRFSATGNLAALIGVTVDGGTGNDTILGSNGIDVLLGGDNNDVIDGQQGNDTVLLGAGDDTAQWDPGDGSDVIEGQTGTDTLLFNGSAANEIMQLSANGGRVLLTRDVGNIVMDLNDVETVQFKALGGADTITLNDLSGTDVTKVSVDLGGSSGSADGSADTVNVNGTNGADTIVIAAISDGVAVTGLPASVEIRHSDAGLDRLTVNGGGGADILDASGPNSGTIALTMQGGSGNDRYIIDEAGDQVVEAAGGGTDDRVLARESYALAAGQDIEVLGTISAASTKAIDLTGNEKAQTLAGNSGANLLDGGAGADTMIGLAGNDRYIVGEAGDQVIEAAGGGTDTVFVRASYALAAGQEVEVLATTKFAGTGTIDLTGNEKVQSLFGNAGANVLDGGLGNDVMTGGGGSDAFLFEMALGASNLDHITDFSSVDTIRLENAVFTGLATGGLTASAFKDIGVAGAQVDANDRILYNHNTGVLSYDADGSGAGNVVQFAVLDNHAALSSADFLVV